MKNASTVKKPILTKKVKNYLFVASLLILPIAHFLVFWLYLNLNSILIAFQDEITGSLTLDNFTRFFDTLKRDWGRDAGIKVCIENTFITAGLRMLVNMPVLVFVSYILFKKYYGHMFFRVVFYLPGIVGTVVTSTMLSYILDAIGPIVMLGQKMGINWSHDILQTGLLGNDGSARITYFATSVLTIAGASVLTLTGSLQKIPKDLFDAGRIDGVGMMREFITLIVPCCWSTIGIMWIMTFAQVWGDYSRVMLLTNGSYKTNNFAYYAFASSLAATKGTENFNYPAAIGVLMTLIITPLTLFLRWFSHKIVEPVEF